MFEYFIESALMRASRITPDLYLRSEVDLYTPDLLKKIVEKMAKMMRNKAIIINH